MEKDIVFVALTRPPLMFSVPTIGWLSNAFFTLLLFGVGRIGIIASGVVFATIHYTLRFLTEYDPNFFNIGKVWLRTRIKATTVHIWGGSLLAPVQVTAVRSPRDITGSV